jgi:hypothetical protein
MITDQAAACAFVAAVRCMTPACRVLVLSSWLQPPAWAVELWPWDRSRPLQSNSWQKQVSGC